MSKRKLQHFVPQYYFRLFNNNSKYIGVIVKSTLDDINQAPICSQCAEKHFYVSQEFEAKLGDFESKHSVMIREIISKEELPRRKSEWHILLSAIVLQDVRTGKLKKSAARPAQIVGDFVLNKVTEEMKAALPEVKPPPIADMLKIRPVEKKFHHLYISAAFESIPLLADLNGVLLINRCDTKFIFSDSPCILINPAAQEYGIADVAHIGYQSPGLVILFPISQDYLIMLYDKSYYYLTANRQKIDIEETRIVNELNIAQLGNSSNTIYYPPMFDSSTLIQSLIDNPSLRQSHERNIFNEHIVSNQRRIIISHDQPLPIDIILPFLKRKPKRKHTLNLARDMQFYSECQRNRQIDPILLPQ